MSDYQDELDWYAVCETDDDDFDPMMARLFFGHEVTEKMHQGGAMQEQDDDGR